MCIPSPPVAAHEKAPSNSIAHDLACLDCLLHIAIENPSGFELVEWLDGDSVVVRFLAGICSHDEYQHHPVYHELVQQLASIELGTLQLVHYAYECPSIMDSVEIKEAIVNVQ